MEFKTDINISVKYIYLILNFYFLLITKYNNVLSVVIKQVVHVMGMFILHMR
jgi:hypothetical protein